MGTSPPQRAWRRVSAQDDSGRYSGSGSDLGSLYTFCPVHLTFLSTYCGPGTVLGAGDRVMTTAVNSCPLGDGS